MTVSPARLRSRTTTSALVDAGRQLEQDQEPAAPMPMPALRVGAANDHAEADADRRADYALRRLSGSGDPNGAGSVGAHRHSGECEHVRRSSAVIGLAGGELDQDSARQIESARGGGQTLDAVTRDRMESGFGQSFEDVRVHADDRASQLNRSVSARAFTTGSDIFFGAGQFAPGTAEGEKVLAHELGHVVQNRFGLQRLELRRLLSKTESDVEAVRSRGGRLKGSITKDTLYRLGRVLSGYGKAKDPKDRLIKVDAILGLCEAYLAKHADVADDAQKVALVEEIYAEARRDHGQAQAQAQYVADARGKSALTAKGTDTNLKFQKQSGQQHVQGGAEAIAAKKPSKMYKGADQETIDLVTEYGLTEAEVVAIKTYTAADYVYINPATANAKGWMEGQNLTDAEKNIPDADPGDALAVVATQAAKEARENKVKQLFEEGSLHAGVAMMGLQKLPAMAGPTYRGARMTQAEFDSRYDPTKPIVFGAFTSTAVREEPARGFANGGGDYKPRPDQTLSVMCILDVKNGRDIRNLSIFGSKEEEWLLLPGATFAITSIVEKPAGSAGSPAATKWLEVHVTQTA